MVIKDAALRTQINYQSATAIYRKHRTKHKEADRKMKQAFTSPPHSTQPSQAHAGWGCLTEYEPLRKGEARWRQPARLDIGSFANGGQQLKSFPNLLNSKKR